MVELSAPAQSLLQSILAMGLLSLAMFIWMYATRLTAFTMAMRYTQEAMNPGSYHYRIPSEVRRVADNYNHLFEAPTIFYAVTLAIVLLGLADSLHVICAWAFVLLRVLHSLVQSTVNRVMLRFALFALSWVAMGTMIVRAAFASF